eukprot:scaffold25564_cov74-Phaeocystis_antarctica.AAC.3
MPRVWTTPKMPRASCSLRTPPPPHAVHHSRSPSTWRCKSYGSTMVTLRATLAMSAAVARVAVVAVRKSWRPARASARPMFCPRAISGAARITTRPLSCPW